MSKYIDADKLIAEIERRMKCYDRDGCEPNDGKWVELVTMKHFIESIQQEQLEVDLEKDIDAFFDKWDKNSNGAIFDENGARVTIETIKGVVKHFLKARKEE